MPCSLVSFSARRFIDIQNWGGRVGRPFTAHFFQLMRSTGLNFWPFSLFSLKSNWMVELSLWLESRGGRKNADSRVRLGLDPLGGSMVDWVFPASGGLKVDIENSIFEQRSVHDIAGWGVGMVVITLLMSGQAQEDRSSFKYHFMAKVMQESQQQTLYRPLRSTHFQEHSAKDIMKQAIIMENKSTPRHHPMKGQLISGSKKPIQQHMHSFLLGIREQIRKEYDKSQLPQLRAPTPPSTNQPSTPKPQAKEAPFLKRLRDSKGSGWTTIDYSRQNSTQRKPHTTDNTSTISHTQQSSERSKAISNTLPRTLSPSPPAVQPPQPTFRKGYMTYHPEAAEFLTQRRHNTGKKPMKELGGAGITAGAYLVMQQETLLPVASKRQEQMIEIASLSKIMTCYLTLLLCEKYVVDLYKHEIRVSQKASETPGTTAELQRGDILTVSDLLFGLMLPSGNDASVALAEGMGKVIQRHKKKPTKKTYYETFIAHMNLLAKELQLEQTWNNSSGLSMHPNHSTPTSIAILTALALKNPLFRQVVNTKSHSADVRNDWFGINRRATWRNTNKLLESGWEGVKTGTTQTAGHCLMALREEQIVCVFACQTLAKRFSECQALYQQCNPAA